MTALMTTTSLADRLQRFMPQVADVAGGQIGYRQAGSQRITHVLLHGIGSASGSWLMQLEAAQGKASGVTRENAQDRRSHGDAQVATRDAADEKIDAIECVGGRVRAILPHFDFDAGECIRQVDSLSRRGHEGNLRRTGGSIGFVPRTKPALAHTIWGEIWKRGFSWQEGKIH